MNKSPTNKSPMNKSPDAFRTISEVAEDLGVPQHVLRFWESKFSQIRPLKRGGGRRYYRPEDVLILKGVQTLLYTDGYTVKGVQKVFREQGPRYVIEAGRADGARDVNGGDGRIIRDNAPLAERDVVLSRDRGFLSARDDEERTRDHYEEDDEELEDAEEGEEDEDEEELEDEEVAVHDAEEFDGEDEDEGEEEDEGQAYTRPQLKNFAPRANMGASRGGGAAAERVAPQAAVQPIVLREPHMDTATRQRLEIILEELETLRALIDEAVEFEGRVAEVAATR